MANTKENKREGLIKIILKRYFIDAMSSMMLGLFASLIIGTILKQFSNISVLSFLAPLADVATNPYVVGAAMGASISWGLKAKPLVIFTAAVTGSIGYYYGGAVGAYVATLVGNEFASLVASKTKIDIIVTPLMSIITGGTVGMLVGPYIDSFMKMLGDFVNKTTVLSPIPMGAAVAVIVGLVLTAPISSAALCIMIGIDGIAAGAAVVGCCCQMVGFAAASARDNNIGGVISQGIGTSMLQFPNILKHPQIWLAPTLASAILGPISAAVLGMTNTPTGAGMGTSGLVGQFGAFEAMSAAGMSTGIILLEIAVMHIIAPAVLTLMFDFVFRRIGLVKPGYMKLENVN